MPISSALGSSALLPAGLGFRNVLINGDMRIAQRGTSFTIPSGGGNNYFAADRWRTRDYTWSAGVNPTVSNETTIVPTGFTNSYKWANGSPALTFASGGSNGIAQTIEGYQAASLYGKSCYLSFWVRSSTAGKYTILFSNGAFTRTLLKTYTVDSPNTWEYKTIPIDMVSAVSSGVWEKTTSAGLGMQFMLGTHADRTGNSNLDAWGDRVFYHYATTDSVNLATIPNSTFYLTGVQLEQNYQPTPFEQRPIGVELQLCQRYYEKTYDLGLNPGSATNNGFVGVGGPDGVASTYFFSSWRYKVEKRTSPTVTIYDTSGNSGKITTWQSGGTTHNVTPSNGNWVNGTNAHSVLHQGSVAGWFYQAVSSAEL